MAQLCSVPSGCSGATGGGIQWELTQGPYFWPEGDGDGPQACPSQTLRLPGESPDG